MRSENDLCLLCKNNLADKKNSHLVPNFMINSLFGPKDAKKGYTHSSKAGVKRSVPVQHSNSIKESHIVCTDCEKKFEKLETYCSRFLHQLNNNTDHKFGVQIIKNFEGFDFCFELTQTNPIVFHLLIYSIIWRLSISSKESFNDFKLTLNEEELLRTSLINHLALTQESLLFNCDKSNFEFNQFTMTTTFKKDSTKHLIYAFSQQRPNLPYLIILNDFILRFGFRGEESIAENLSYILNNKFSSIVIGIQNENSWYAGLEIIKNKFFA